MAEVAALGFIKLSNDSKKPLGKSSDANNEILLKIKENLVNVSQIKDLPIQVIDGYGVVRLQVC